MVELHLTLVLEGVTPGASTGRAGKHPPCNLPQGSVLPFTLGVLSITQVGSSGKSY